MAEEDLSETLRARAQAICETRFPGFVLEECLGAGASAAVFTIANGDKRQALKVYDPKFFSGKNQRVERRRIKLQLDLRDHKRSDLVEIFDADEVDESAFILMELIPWVSLDKEIGSIPMECIPGLIAQVASAARYLEERGMTHRDIKPANIMVSRDHKQAKLLDLGVVRALGSESGEPLTDADGELPFVATVQYSSPEYLFRLGQHDDDFWRGLTFYQLGGVLHDMIVGVPLFDRQAKTRNKYVLAYAVLFEKPQIPSEGVPPSLVALARNALQKSLSNRLKSIEWADFLGQEKSVESLRLKLGLGATASARKPVNRALLESYRIKLDDAAKALQASITSVMRREGYPAATIDIRENGLSERKLNIEFPMADCQLEWVVVRVSISAKRDEAENSVAISLSGGLARSSDPWGVQQEGAVVWVADLDKLQDEASSAANEIEVRLLRIYGDAVANVSEWVSSFNASNG